MKSERISIIIPTYQHASVLSLCLKAIFAQSRLPDEIIVVNDGSSDETEKILEPFMDRIVYLFQENKGNQIARMRGFQQSTGSLILFCDADVLMHPTMLEKMEKTIKEHPEVSYVYSSFRFGWKCFSFDVERLKKMNYIHTSTLIRRDDFPGFDFQLKKFQDWDLWLTLLEREKKGIFLNEVLFEVLVSARRGGISDWIPSFMYQWPWKCFSRKKKAIRAYEEGKKILFKKHHL